MANAVVETKLRAIGDEVAVMLPKEVVAAMKLKPDDDILLVPTDNGYKIAVKDDAFKKQMEAAREGMARYKDALRELAK